MIFGDPNAFLGGAGLLGSALITVLILSSGLVAIAAATVLLRVRSWIGFVVVAYYLFVGVFAYMLLGPFALSPDGPVYDQQALTFATNLGYEPEPVNPWSLDHGKWGWPIILSVFYAVDGRFPLTGVLINCVLMGMIAVLVARTTQLAFRRVSYPTLYGLFLLFPGYVLLGPTSMREPMCWFGIALVALGYAYWTTRMSPMFALFMMVLGILLVAWIRLPLGVLVFLGLAAGMIVGILWDRFRTTGVLVGLVAVSIGVLLFVDEAAFLVGYDLYSIIETRNYLSAAATTGFAVNAGPLSALGPGALLFSTFIKILVGPFPWELGGQVVWLWIVANLVLWLVVLGLALVGLRTVAPKRIAIVYLTLAGVVLLGMGLTLTNYGIVVRLRTTPLVVMAIVIAGSDWSIRVRKPSRRMRFPALAS